MAKIGGFGSYQNFMDQMISSKGKKSVSEEKSVVSGYEKKSGKAGLSVQKKDKTGGTALSEKAQKLLEELRETYKDTDFMIADVESDEEKQAIMSRGTKQYSVLMSSEDLEKMAADEETKNKYLQMIDDAKAQLGQVHEDLDDELLARGERVSRIGVSFESDGTMKFFAELEKLSEKQKERIEKAKEEKEAAQKEEEQKVERKSEELTKWEEDQNLPLARTKVSAGSYEELLEKIRAVDWSQAETVKNTGSRIDFSV